MANLRCPRGGQCPRSHRVSHSQVIPWKLDKGADASRGPRPPAPSRAAQSPSSSGTQEPVWPAEARAQAPSWLSRDKALLCQQGALDEVPAGPTEAQARDCSLWVCTCVALGMQVWVRPGCWTHGKDTSPENTKWTLGPLAGPGHVPERALGASLNTALPALALDSSPCWAVASTPLTLLHSVGKAEQLTTSRPQPGHTL